MDTFTLISNLISSLAWPVAVCVLVYALRRDLGKAIISIKKFKYKDTEIDFGEELQSVASAASKELPPESSSKVENTELVNFFPRGAVIESWLKIEEALKQFCVRHGLEHNLKKPFSLRNIDWHNHEYRVLGKGTLEILVKLKGLRNEAVHLQDSSISPESAKEYQSLSSRIIQVIEQA